MDSKDILNTWIWCARFLMLFAPSFNLSNYWLRWDYTISFALIEFAAYRVQLRFPVYNAKRIFEYGCRRCTVLDFLVWAFLGFAHWAKSLVTTQSMPKQLAVRRLFRSNQALTAHTLTKLLHRTQRCPLLVKTGQQTLKIYGWWKESHVILAWGADMQAVWNIRMVTVQSANVL